MGLNDEAKGECRHEPLLAGANLLDKLGMRDRVELTRSAIRIGLIEA